MTTATSTPVLTACPRHETHTPHVWTNPVTLHTTLCAGANRTPA